MSLEVLHIDRKHSNGMDIPFLDGTIWLAGSPLIYACKKAPLTKVLFMGIKVTKVDMTKAEFWELAKQGKF